MLYSRLGVHDLSRDGFWQLGNRSGLVGLGVELVGGSTQGQLTEVSLYLLGGLCHVGGYNTHGIDLAEARVVVIR